jgi:hypothetical protein
MTTVHVPRTEELAVAAHSPDQAAKLVQQSAGAALSVTVVPKANRDVQTPRSWVKQEMPAGALVTWPLPTLPSVVTDSDGRDGNVALTTASCTRTTWQWWAHAAGAPSTTRLVGLLPVVRVMSVPTENDAVQELVAQSE